MTHDREHHSDEFGQAPRPERIHVDPTTQILLDGIVERESGRVPGPPVVPLWVVVVVLAVMFAIGIAVSFALPRDGWVNIGNGLMIYR